MKYTSVKKGNCQNKKIVNKNKKKVSKNKNKMGKTMGKNEYQEKIPSLNKVMCSIRMRLMKEMNLIPKELPFLF